MIRVVAHSMVYRYLLILWFLGSACTVASSPPSVYTLAPIFDLSQKHKDQLEAFESLLEESSHPLLEEIKKRQKQGNFSLSMEQKVFFVQAQDFFETFYSQLSNYLGLSEMPPIQENFENRLEEVTDFFLNESLKSPEHLLKNFLTLLYQDRKTTEETPLFSANMTNIDIEQRALKVLHAAAPFLEGVSLSRDISDQIQNLVTSRLFLKYGPSLIKDNEKRLFRMYALKVLEIPAFFHQGRVKDVLDLYFGDTNKEVQNHAHSVMTSHPNVFTSHLTNSLKETPSRRDRRQYAVLYDEIKSPNFQEDVAHLLGINRQTEKTQLFTFLNRHFSSDTFSLYDFLQSRSFEDLPLSLKDWQIKDQREFLARLEVLDERLQSFKRNFQESLKENMWANKQKELPENPLIFMQNMWGWNFLSYAIPYIDKQQWDMSLWHILYRVSVERYRSHNPPNRQSLIKASFDNIISDSQKPRTHLAQMTEILSEGPFSLTTSIVQDLLQIISQRNLQERGGANVIDMGNRYQSRYDELRPEPEEVSQKNPEIMQPLLVFLMSALKQNGIDIPATAFVEVDLSFLLHSIARMDISRREEGGLLFLVHSLMRAVPSMAAQNYDTVRGHIAQIDQMYDRKHSFFRYLRLKIHRSSSKRDLDLISATIDAITDNEWHKEDKYQEAFSPVKTIIRQVSNRGQVDTTVIKEIENMPEKNKRQMQRIGQLLLAIQTALIKQDRITNESSWLEIANIWITESPTNQKEEALQRWRGQGTQTKKDALRNELLSQSFSSEEIDVAIHFLELLHNLTLYWNPDYTSPDFLQKRLPDWSLLSPWRRVEELQKLREKSFEDSMRPYDYHEVSPETSIKRKQHQAQTQFGFVKFGEEPQYKESKWQAYLDDRRISTAQIEVMDDFLNDKKTQDDLLELHTFLVYVLDALNYEGLLVSKESHALLDILKYDTLTLEQMSDITQLLLPKEIDRIPVFIDHTFRDIVFQNVQHSLKRDEFSAEVLRDTFLADLLASTPLLPLIRKTLHRVNNALDDAQKKGETLTLKPLYPSEKKRRGPAQKGLKAIFLERLSNHSNGFSVPSLDVIDTSFFQDLEKVDNPLEKHKLLRSQLLKTIFNLETRTGQLFPFQKKSLSKTEQEQLNSHRASLSTSSKKTLTLSVRSGSFISLPGAMESIINIGHLSPFADATVRDIEEEKFLFDNYRWLLTTWGASVLGISEKMFSQIIDDVKIRNQKIRSLPNPPSLWSLDTSSRQEIINRFEALLEKTWQNTGNTGDIHEILSDPFEQLISATGAVYASWNSETANQMRDIFGFKGEWKTPVTIQQMRYGNADSLSMSAILFSGNPGDRKRVPYGNIKFRAQGMDIASGLSSYDSSLSDVQKNLPKLYQQIENVLRQLKRLHGGIDVDIEIVAEHGVDTQGQDFWDLYLLQVRQVPLAIKGPSENWVLDPEVSNEALSFVSQGRGVHGGAQTGVMINAVRPDGETFSTWREILRQKLIVLRQSLGDQNDQNAPGIFLLLDYVTPEDALLLDLKSDDNSPLVDGVVTSAIGGSTHASLIARRLQKLFISGLEGLSFNRKKAQWSVRKRKIEEGKDVYTLVAWPGSRYAGHVFLGEAPLVSLASLKEESEPSGFHSLFSLSRTDVVQHKSFVTRAA